MPSVGPDDRTIVGLNEARVGRPMLVLVIVFLCVVGLVYWATKVPPAQHMVFVTFAEGLCVAGPVVALTLRSFRRPTVIFRSETMSVARTFGLYRTVRYGDLEKIVRKYRKAGWFGVLRKGTLRTFDVPVWLLTPAERAEFRAELIRRAPWLAEPGPSR